MVGIKETTVALFAGTGEVTVGGPMDASGASTVNPFPNEAVCPPVDSVTPRAPAAAAGSIVNVAVALVGLAMVSTPDWPSAAPDTLMPGPKLASVCPCRKPVFAPVRDTVKTSPARPEVGLTDTSVAAGPPVAAWTAIVTALDVRPPIEIVTGTALPGAVDAGTRAFTWYSPTKPGARPEKITWAGTPPMLTAGVVVVLASGLVGDPPPLAG